VRRRIASRLTQHRINKMSALSNRPQMFIKAISIHDISQLQDLKGNLDGRPSSILIIKIVLPASGHPEAARKLVNELYSKHIKNNYSVFRLEEDRFMTIPNNIRVENLCK